jgi:hypothetical protein
MICAVREAVGVSFGCPKPTTVPRPNEDFVRVGAFVFAFFFFRAIIQQGTAGFMSSAQPRQKGSVAVANGVPQGGSRQSHNGSRQGRSGSRQDQRGPLCS